MAVNPKPSLMTSDDLSPNQLAKRNKIVQAASRLMVRDGIHACTARTISAECGFSTSSIHYYFKDTDEILDLAIRRVMERFLSAIEEAAAAHEDPALSLRAAALAYFELTSSSIRASDDAGGRHEPMVWFEFQARSMRTGDIRTVQELAERGAALFLRLMSKCDVTDPQTKADTLYSSLLGAAIRASMTQRTVGDWVDQLFKALELPMPGADRTRTAAPRRTTRKVNVN